MDSKNKCCYKNERTFILKIHEWNKNAGIDINRKMLSEIAINDPKAFAELVDVAKNN